MPSASDMGGSWKTLPIIVYVVWVFRLIMSWSARMEEWPCIVRHNEIRDLATYWMNEACSETEKEPQLQPLSGENILLRTSNKQEEARVHDTKGKAKGFWSRQQRAFFDVRVFHPNASSYRNTSIAALYRRQEQAKKREYGDRIGEVEHASLHLRFFQQQEGSVKTPQ